MGKTYPDMAAVLGVLHAQGSRHVTLEVLEEKTTLLDDLEQDEKLFPCLGMANGVVWFFDKDRRPLNAQGALMKAKAPPGNRGLLGDLEAEGSLVLVEGERDYLTALSLRLNAICCGGTATLSEAAKQAIAEHAKKTVVVLFDNDPPGRDAADQLGAELKLLKLNTVRIARIPVDGADLSEWVDGFDYREEAAGAVMTLLAKAQTVKLKDAKAQIAKVEAEKYQFTDERRLDDGSLLTPIWVPDDFERPHELYTGHVKLLYCDAARTAITGFPVVQILDEYTEVSDDIYGHHESKAPVLRPLTNDVFPKRILVTPSNAVEHGNSESLFDDLVTFCDSYFVIRPEFLKAMAAYIMLTYRYQDAKMETLPYLAVVGRAGEGKTRFGRVMFETCYRSLFVTAMRPVHLYRIVEMFEGGGVTMVFEELRVNDRSEDSAEFRRLLNAGNQRGVWVPRMGGRQFSEIDWMRLFCPKVFGLDGHFTDEGMMRRCITAHLGQLSIPTNKRFEVLPLEFYQRGAELRNRLLGWRCSKLQWATPTFDPALRDEAVEMGIWQNYFPLIAMVPKAREEAVHQILALARDSQCSLSQVREASPEIFALEAMINVIEERQGREFIMLEKVLATLNEWDRNARWDNARLTDALRTLHLAPRRTKVSEHGVSRNVRVLDVDNNFATCVAKHRMELDEARRQQQKAAQGIM